MLRFNSQYLVPTLFSVFNFQACFFWTDWNEFGDCSAECGGGIRSRERICINPDNVVPACEGSNSDLEACNTQVRKIRKTFYGCIDTC